MYHYSTDPSQSAIVHNCFLRKKIHYVDFVAMTYFIENIVIHIF